MKTNSLIKVIGYLSALFILITFIACAGKQQNSVKGLSADAVKIAPLFKSDKFQDMPYRYFEPAVNGGAKYPIVLYLHGENEFGTDNESQLTATECATIWVEQDHLAKNPTYVLAPQAPKGSDWTAEPVYSNTLALLNKFVEDHPQIDRNRIYIVGFSEGATGVWNMIIKNPKLFAAAMPISGNADKFLGNRDTFVPLKNFPVVAIHSLDDPFSPVTGSLNALAALRAAGNVTAGSANISIWGMGSVNPPHNAWYPAFHNYEVIYNWMFEQSLERTNNGEISPYTLFTVRDLGNGVKQIWDYNIGTAYVIEHSDKAVVIDAAACSGSICQFIRDKVLVNKEIPLDIFITHRDGDHIGGLSSFIGYANLKNVYVHEYDSDPVIKQLGADAGKVKFIKEGDVYPFGDANIEVIEVLGHTLGCNVMKYKNILFTGDAIGSGDAWLGGKPYSIEEYAISIQHLLDKIGDGKYSIYSGHTGEFRSPLTEEYIHQVLACAKGIVDGSISGVPYRRTMMGNTLTKGYAGTYGRSTILYDLVNVHQIKGALRSLIINPGIIGPAFFPYTAYYSAKVADDVALVSVTAAVLAKDYKSLTVNGESITSGTPCKINLVKGDNQILVVVTATDNSQKTYTLTITRGN